jgi:hypothetical protein
MTEKNELDGLPGIKEFSRRLVERGLKHQEERNKVKGEDLVFKIPAYEQKTMREWSAKHKKTCRMRVREDGSTVEFPGGAAGGLTTFSFTPTGIGMAICVKCACGEEANITDYDNW